MRKGKRALAPKIDEKATEWMGNIFPSINAGATVLLESGPDLYYHTLAEMRGLFSLDELRAITDTMNGDLLIVARGGGYLGGNIRPKIEDAVKIHPGKWGVDEKALVKKIRGLSRWQAVVLEMWAGGYWQLQPVELEDYSKHLIGA